MVNTITEGFFKSLVHKHFRERQFSSTGKMYYSEKSPDSSPVLHLSVIQ